MLIQANTVQHWIDHFYGYGTWNAPFWFVGYEESGGDLPEEVAEKLNYFYQAHANVAEPTLCNIRELYKQIAFRVEGPRLERFTNFYDHRFGPNAVQHGFWKNMIAFSYGYQDQQVPDTLDYQQKQFVRSNEALINLYPLPAHNHAWYYSWLDLPNLPFLKSRLLYEQHVYATRVAGLFNQVIKYRPQLVVMYAMENINMLKASVLDFFPSATFKTVKAIKEKIPQYHRADLSGSTLIMTTQRPGLRHNRVETGFDWEAFGKSLTK